MPLAFRNTLPRRPPEWASRQVLLDYVRSCAPDLRIRKERQADGTRACYARFTMYGEALEVEAVEAPDLPDPDDAIVRRCAWLVYRRLGIATPLADANKERLRQAIMEAAREGDTVTAERLGRELAMANEGMLVRVPLRVQGWDR